MSSQPNFKSINVFGEYGDFHHELSSSKPVTWRCVDCMISHSRSPEPQPMLSTFSMRFSNILDFRKSKQSKVGHAHRNLDFSSKVNWLPISITSLQLFRAHNSWRRRSSGDVIAFASLLDIKTTTTTRNKHLLFLFSTDRCWMLMSCI